jgi:hypothetical protein
MTDFADELRVELAAKDVHARAAAAAEVEEQQAAVRRFEEARHAAAALLEDVCRPLVEDFGAVMRARGVLREGQIRREFPAAYRQDAAQVRLVFRALGAARARCSAGLGLPRDGSRRGAGHGMSDEG